MIGTNREEEIYHPKFSPGENIIGYYTQAMWLTHVFTQCQHQSSFTWANGTTYTNRESTL